MEVSHLHPYTQRLMAHFDDVEGVQDGAGVIELVIDRVLVPVERVQGRDLHSGPERLPAVGEPVLIRRAGAAGVLNCSSMKSSTSGRMFRRQLLPAKMP